MSVTDIQLEAGLDHVSRGTIFDILHTRGFKAYLEEYKFILHRQKCKSTIDCVTRTPALVQLIASFPWTPARHTAYSRL